MVSKERERLADDLARALVVITDIEAMLPRRVVEDGEINLAFACASNEGICTFENLWGVASGPHEKERRQIEGFALQRANARPFADRVVVQRSFSIEDPEVPDRVERR